MLCESVLIPGSKLAIVGEAPGEQEELLGRPFVGASGQELARILSTVGIDFNSCSRLNVFSERPPQNKIEAFTAKKSECGHGYNYPQISQGKYFLPKYLHNLVRLKSELESIRPNLVLALGNTACWALLGAAGISKFRGTATASSLSPEIKVLPTYHPSAVLRQWELRPVVLADCIKAKREMEFPDIIRPERQIWIDPTLEDMETFYERYLKHAEQISFDIETGGQQITCIGFAPSSSVALVVPFHDRRRALGSYWDTAEMEAYAWRYVRKVLALPHKKVGQNLLYDIQWLWRQMGIPVAGEIHDTMLAHHSLQPELEKGLGFLGSIYTNEASWKLMRHRAARTETTKLDE